MEDRKSSARPSRLPCRPGDDSMVFWWRPSVRPRGQSGSCGNGGLVGPEPGRQRFRGANGPCSFGVDALLKPAHSSALLGPSRGRLATSLRLQPDQQPCTGLQLRCAPTTNSPALDSNLHYAPTTNSELQSSTPILPARLHCGLGVSARPFIGWWGAFGLSPLTLYPPLAPPLLSF